MGLGALRIYYAASFAALGAYLPFFPAWLEARGIRGVAMGLVAGLVPGLSLVAPVAFGMIADALSLRGWLLRLACAGAAAPFAALATFAALGDGPTPISIVACVGIFALFRSPMVSLADALTMERTAAMGTRYGRIRLWGSLGFVAAALATPHLVDPRGARTLPVVIAAWLVLALAASFALPAKTSMPPRPVPGEVRRLLAAPAFRGFLIATVLGQGAHSAYDLCFSLHVVDLGGSPRLAGAAWAIGVLAEVALMALLRPSAGSSVGAPRLLPLALGGAAIRWALMAVAPSATLLLAIAPLHAVSFALAWTSSLAFVAERAPAGILATAQGLFSASGAVGMTLGMIGWGALYRAQGGAVVFGAATIPSLLACLVASSVLRGDRGALTAARPSPASDR